MSWEALGAIAELAGAIAVFATLVYLTMQIRQSNRLALSQYRETNRITMLNITEPIIRDRDFAALIEQTATSPDGVSPADIRRVRSQLQNELLAAQSLFVRGRLMSEERMERISRNLAVSTIQRHPLASELWQSTEYDPDFAAHVTALLDQNLLSQAGASEK